MPSLTPCDLPEPTLDGDQVLVAVQAAVVGAAELAPGPAHTPGGAAVGTVLRTGHDAAHLAGARVLVGPEQPCGECDICRRGSATVCPRGTYLGVTADGALATAVVARARWVCALQGELVGAGLDGPAAALVAREAAQAYAMFARAGVAPGEPVVIVGHGVIARFLVEIGLSRGVRPMVVTGEPGFAAWIEAQGAIALRVDGDDADGARRAALAAAEASGLGSRPFFVFETSAEPGARRLALGLSGPGARITLLARRALGRLEPGPALPLDAAVDHDAVLIGVAGAHPDLLPEVAALVVRGELDVQGAAELVPAASLAAARPRLDAQPPRALVAVMD